MPILSLEQKGIIISVLAVFVYLPSPQKSVPDVVLARIT